MLSRFTLRFSAASLSTLVLFVAFQRVQWRALPHAVGLGEAYGPSHEQIATGENILPDLREGRPDLAIPDNDEDETAKDTFTEPKVESNSLYPVGQTKPAGSNYTRTLVIPTMHDEDTNWINDDLNDMLAPNGLLRTAIYVIDDKTAALHPPKNKGNEVMVYLSYIIDSYDDLPDIAIFMHNHRSAWHNSEMLDHLSPLMIRHMSPERVIRQGYMNLRCEWDPGCPDWLHPGSTEWDYYKQEESVLAASWAELFPMEPIPTVVAQPCCAQFAVSRERILALPKQRYVSMRDWLLRTDLSDYLSGRVFEYSWHYIFTASSTHCPSMSACYCDGYGLCFGTRENFDYWFKLRYQQSEFQEELDVWHNKAEAIEEWRKSNKVGEWTEEALLNVPEVGRDVWLRGNIEEIQADMDARRDAAFELGRDPRQRALEVGRDWHEGDGY